MAIEDWFITRARVSAKMHKKPTIEDKTSFFQQLSTLITSGSPLLDAIQISAGQSQSQEMRRVLQEVAGRVAAGSTLHGAAARYPRIFEPEWVEVIRTGEITGQMSLGLQELNKQIREAREVRKKMIGGLMYPVILIGASVVAVTLMLWLVVPTFATMFRDMGSELPAITQFVVRSSELIVRYGLYVVAALVAAVFGARKYWKSESGRRRISGFGLAVPLIGELLVQSAMYRFASSISLLLKSGVPLLDTLTVLRGIFRSNPIYREALAQAQSRVAAGRPLARSLEETGLFTSMITSMIRIGEESGQLAPVMEQVSGYYRERIDGLTSRVSKLLEPIIIVAMGGTIACIMLSIYLPMFEMAGKVN